VIVARRNILTLYTANVAVHKEVVNSSVVEKLFELLKVDVDELQSNIALVFARLGKSGMHIGITKKRRKKKLKKTKKKIQIKI
jgi:hypothetical protein